MKLTNLCQNKSNKNDKKRKCHTYFSDQVKNVICIKE